MGQRMLNNPVKLVAWLEKQGRIYNRRCKGGVNAPLGRGITTPVSGPLRIPVRVVAEGLQNHVDLRARQVQMGYETHSRSDGRQDAALLEMGLEFGRLRGGNL